MTEPPAPIPAAALPRDDAGRLAWLRLIRSPRVGAATFRRLLAEHGSAEAALEALPALAAASGAEGYRPCPPEVARAEQRAAARAGLRPLHLGAPGYPPLLAQVPDAPPILWALGDPALAARPCVALVGARNASALGVRMAGHMARGLGEGGMVTVSGLARGIDTAVHQASLSSGTIAVVAGGADVVYPPENAALAARIGAEGLILSEMPPGLAPQARHFPRRNRLVSGIAPGLVVVEGAAKSGSLITARTALDQGREVMAVPGHPFDARAAGCNLLIRDGATLVRGADDVLAVLTGDRPARPVPGPTPPPARGPAPPSTGALGPRILALLGPSPVAEDALIRQLRAPPPEVLAALTDLDIAGAVDRHAGGLVSRAGP